MVFADGAVARGLHAEGQPEDLDEPDRRSVIEGIALVVGCQVPVVQGERRTATGNNGSTVIKAHPDLAGYDTLR